MKQTILIIILFSITSSLFPYESKIDSLKNILKTLSGIERVGALNDLAKEYSNLSPEETMNYGTEALELSQKLEYNKGEALSLNSIGIGNLFLGNYQKSIEYFKKSLKLFEEIEDKEGIASSLNKTGLFYYHLSDYSKALEYYKKSLKISNEIADQKAIAMTLNNIGVIYGIVSNYDKSLEYYLQSLKIYEEIGDRRGVASILGNIGIVYGYLINYDKALEHYHKSLKIYKEIGNRTGIANSLNNMGMIYSNLENYDKALEYYLKSLAIKEEIGDKKGIANSLNNIGNIYENLNDYDKSIEYFLKSFMIQKEIGDKWGIANTSNDIGNIYIKLQDFSKALEYLKEGLKIAQEIKANGLIKDNYKAFSELYSVTDNYKKAFEYYQLYSEVRDSIFSEQSSEKVAEMQTKYETEKKEKENELLQRDNEIYRLEIEKQKLLKWRLYFGLFIGVIFVFIIYYRYRLKQTENQRLEKKIEEALKKQREQQQIIVHQASLTSLGELAAGIAHEINQPLQNISLSIESIDLEMKEIKSDKEYINKTVKEIYEDIKRISKIIDHIRIFSSGQKDEILDEFSINTSIENAISMMNNQFLEYGIKVNVDLDDDICPVPGNPYKYEQVVLNLLANAKDAVLEKENYERIINVKTYQTKGEVVLEVEDNGIGIKTEEQTNIFVPFYTTKEINKGSGLGLSISYGIIKEMNGNIDFESKYHKGTTIRVIIPILMNESMIGSENQKNKS